MSTESLRNELIAWIGKVEDKGLLKALVGLKKLLQGQGGANALSEEERAAIRSRFTGNAGSDEERMFWSQIAAAGSMRAYDEHEPDISGLTLLEPNPDYKP